MLAQSAIRTHHHLDTVFQRYDGRCPSSGFRIRGMTKNFPHQHVNHQLVYPDSRASNFSMLIPCIAWP